MAPKISFFTDRFAKSKKASASNFNQTLGKTIGSPQAVSKSDLTKGMDETHRDFQLLLQKRAEARGEQTQTRYSMQGRATASDTNLRDSYISQSSDALRRSMDLAPQAPINVDAMNPLVMHPPNVAKETAPSSSKSQTRSPSTDEEFSPKSPVKSATTPAKSKASPWSRLALSKKFKSAGSLSELFHSNGSKSKILAPLIHESEEAPSLPVDALEKTEAHQKTAEVPQEASEAVQTTLEIPSTSSRFSDASSTPSQKDQRLSKLGPIITDAEERHKLLAQKPQEFEDDETPITANGETLKTPASAVEQNAFKTPLLTYPERIKIRQQETPETPLSAEQEEDFKSFKKDFTEFYQATVPKLPPPSIEHSANIDNKAFAEFLTSIPDDFKQEYRKQGHHVPNFQPPSNI